MGSQKNKKFKLSFSFKYQMDGIYNAKETKIKKKKIP